MVDQGIQLGGSELFISLAVRGKVAAGATGVEAHASLGLRERCNHPLRTTFRKLRLDYPILDKELLPLMAVKAMNDTLGPEGLFPSSLVFGEYPKVQTPSEAPQLRQQLLRGLNYSRPLAGKCRNLWRNPTVSRALKHALPVAADKDYEYGDQVLVECEKIVSNRIGEWLEPFQVLGKDADEKIVYVQNTKVGNARAFNEIQVKRYIPSNEISSSLFQELLDCFGYFLSLGMKEDDIFLTEIIHPRPACNLPRDDSGKASGGQRSKVF